MNLNSDWGTWVRGKTKRRQEEEEEGEEEEDGEEEEEEEAFFTVPLESLPAKSRIPAQLRPTKIVAYMQTIFFLHELFRKRMLKYQ